MANLYNNNNDGANNYSYSPQEPDEISLFLQQILLRSSSSSSSALIRQQQQPFAAVPSDYHVGENQEPAMAPGPGQISMPEPSSRLNSSSGCSFTARAIANVSSSSVGNLDNEPDEYDYESEEAVETMVEEAALKPTPPRSSSKRSRAAEVHNLSEKRRRSRINEKMKALQNLIPNSNKTDKASMLDEAIEYLKQLQLQVQMLTMRNGLSLYPICLPGMLQASQIPQMRMDISDRDKSLNINMAKPVTMDQNITADALFNLQDNCIKQAPIVDFSTITASSKTSSELELSIQDHFRPFQFPRSTKEKVLCGPTLNKDCPQNNSSGKDYCLAAKEATSGMFEAQSSGLKEGTLEACLARGDRLIPNFADNPIFSSQLNM